MTVSSNTLAAIYYFARLLARMEGKVEDEEVQVLDDFLGTFHNLDRTTFQKVLDRAETLDNDKALDLIKRLDDDAKKQVGKLFLNIISANGMINDQEEDLFQLIKENCNLPVSLDDSDAIRYSLWDPEAEESETGAEEGEGPEEVDDGIVPAFLVVNFNGVGTMQQSENEDWATLGEELASWIRARRVEVVRFTPPLNALSEELNLLGRHLVFLIARGYEDTTVGDNAPASILYGGGGPLYGNVVFALETDGDYEIEGFRTLSLFNQAMQAINEAVDGLIELPVVTLGGQEEETVEEVEEEKAWPDEADGVPYNMDWETIHNNFCEEDQAVGLAALHGDAASLAKYARMYRENSVYYEPLLEIKEGNLEEAGDAYEGGKILYLADMYEDAIQQFMKAAKRGDMYAMYLLGVCWEELWEKSGCTKDECQIHAFEWYLKAAVRLHPMAYYKIGRAYSCSDSVPNEEGDLVSDEDFAAAAFWFREGVVLGDSDCANNLAGMYLDGEGVDQDKVKAVELYRKALELNPDNSVAQYNLGLCYEKGNGVPASDEEACKWYWKAKDKMTQAKARYAILRYNRNPGDSTAIALLKEAANSYNDLARRALDELGIPY